MDIFKESISISLGWVAVCIGVHIGSAILSPLALGQSFKALPSKEKTAWYNRTASLFHACCMSVFALNYWVYRNPDQSISESNDPYVGHTIDIMMGYLWYDGLNEIYRYLCGNSLAVDNMSHHILGLISHYSSRLSDNGALGFYSMLIYIAELSTPFLHISWLLQKLGMSSSPLFAVTALFLIASFFLFRVLLGPFMLHHMQSHRSEWGHSSNVIALYYFNFAIVALFVVLNYFWFYKLVSLALRSLRKTSKKRSQ